MTVDSDVIINELLNERRKDRRARLVRLGVWCVFAATLLFLLFSGSDDSKEVPAGNYAALVNLEGTISPDSHTTSAESMQKALSLAFKDPAAKGVMIRVSSPGGTPVQADLIRQEILRLKAKYDKRVVVVGEEMLTSGAYLASMGADVIYANPSTIVGSIGVKMEGFGTNGIMKTLGVERRVYTAGADKVSMDPYQPESPKGVEHVTTLLGEIHGNFIDAVKQGRGDKLSDSVDLFTGQFWSGSQAVKIGLIDGLETVRSAAQSEFGVTQFKLYKPDVSLLARLQSAAALVSSAFSPLASSNSAISASW